MPEYAPIAPSAVADLGGGVVGGRRGEGDAEGGATAAVRDRPPPPLARLLGGRLDPMARCANPATAPHGADAQLGQNAGSGLARGSRRQKMSVLRRFWAFQVGCHGPWRDLEMWQNEHFDTELLIFLIKNGSIYMQNEWF